MASSSTTEYIESFLLVIKLISGLDANKLPLDKEVPLLNFICTPIYPPLVYYFYSINFRVVSLYIFYLLIQAILIFSFIFIKEKN